MISKILFISAIISSSILGQWLRVPEIPETTNVPSFYVEGETIYAGADSIIYISTNQGESWNASNRIHPEVDFVSAVIKHNDRIFAGTYNFGVFETTDNGITWIERNNGLIGSGAKTISDFAIRDNKLYASTIGSGIFQFDLATNNSWQSFNTGIPFGLSYNVNSLSVHNQVLYAGAGGNGYYYTNQPGSQEWVEHQFGEISGLELMFYDILLLNSTQFIVSSYGLYKSTDNGNTWNFFDTGTGYLSTGNFINTGSDIFVAMTKSSRTIWLSSPDNGESWNFWDELFGQLTLNAVYIDGKILDGRLYGLYYRTLDPNNVDDDKKLPEKFILNQNYPNPFNPATTLSFVIKHPSFVSLKVYDILGNEVATLVNDELSAGEYEVDFNASHLSSGSYYYVLSYGNFSSAKKMMLVK